MGKYMLAFTISGLHGSPSTCSSGMRTPEETSYFRSVIPELAAPFLRSSSVAFLRFPFSSRSGSRTAAALLVAFGSLSSSRYYVIVLPSCIPTFQPERLRFFAFIGIGGICGLALAFAFSRRLTLSYPDPRLAASLNLTN